MDLPLAYRLIGEARNQPSHILKVRGREEAREVGLMAEAGLVETNKLDRLDPTEAVITRITHAGHQFYQALKNIRSFSGDRPEGTCSHRYR
jgi:hypothetical protein